jgi:hypothetical protein
MKKEMITIKIRRPGSSISKMKVEKGNTVKDVIKDLLYSGDNLYISVNGKEKSLDVVLKENDLLSILFSTRNKATVKYNGNIWRIHINDKDDFPSNFHAHNIETGEKLDLYNGCVYNPVTKKLIFKVHKKDLIVILLELKIRKVKELSFKAYEVLRSFDNSSKTA